MSRSGAARILVTQVGASRTRIFYPLLGWNSATRDASNLVIYSAGPTQHIVRTNGSGYLQGDVMVTAGFKKLAGANPWTFEAVLGEDGGPAAVGLELAI